MQLGRTLLVDLLAVPLLMRMLNEKDSIVMSPLPELRLIINLPLLYI